MERQNKSINFFLSFDMTVLFGIFLSALVALHKDQTTEYMKVLLDSACLISHFFHTAAYSLLPFQQAPWRLLTAPNACGTLRR